MNSKRKFLAAAALTLATVMAHPAAAAEIKVLTAGAMKEVVLSMVPDFEKQTGHKVRLDNDTVGALARRIQGGETFDVLVATPALVNELAKRVTVVAATRALLARVGVGVMVKEGAQRPDVGSVEAFKQALRAAKSVAYIDPASGGSSGIYVAGLLERLGIAEAVKPKTRLKKGGHVADLIVSGEAELGIHQISEILPVRGVTLVGPLPAEIQNYTTYAAAVSASSKEAEPAAAFIAILKGASADAAIKARGMERPGS